MTTRFNGKECSCNYDILTGPPRTRKWHYCSRNYFLSLWVHPQISKCCWIFRFLWSGFVNFLLFYWQSFYVSFDIFRSFFLTETTVLWCEETTLFWLYKKCVNNDSTISRTIYHGNKWFHFRNRVIPIFYYLCISCWFFISLMLFLLFFTFSVNLNYIFLSNKSYLLNFLVMVL